MGKSFSFVCPRCGNNDINLIGFIKDKPYCRACISFNGNKAKPYKIYKVKTKAKLNYNLTPKQKEISSCVVSNFKNKINTLIHAVCGSGKTEISFGLISYCLSNGLQVGFAVPRKDVVIDLLPRFMDAYPNRKIIALYGGHTEEIEGDLIILTTHQLYRYEHYFDALILDEIDAFPFHNNKVLYNIFKNSLKGNYVMMSATPSLEVINIFKKDGHDILKLYKRFHGKPLIVPKCFYNIKLINLFRLYKFTKEYISKKKPLLIYVPTIELGEKIFSFLNLFFKKGKLVHSKCEYREKYIALFKERKFDFLVTTSILERGITIKNLQVIIYQADHTLFTEGILVQISGRVGRKYDAPNGDVIFIANKENLAIKNCIKSIKEINAYED